MFTCLEILPEKEGLFWKICEKIKPAPLEREYVQVMGATPFLRISVRGKNIDWYKISSSLTGGERVLLTDGETEIPAGVGLSPCTSQALGLNIMFRAFLKFAEKSKASHKISVSVYDKDGFLIPEIKKLVPVVRRISVYTEKIREYFYASSKIMEESGLSIKLNEYSSHAFSEKIIIADKYSRDMKDAKLVFLADNSVISHNTVTGEGICLENDYRALKGDGIDDFLFASALFMYNKADFLKEKDFRLLHLAGRGVSEELITERLAGQGNT